MLSIVLNIIGIILILYSIYIINKDISKKNILSDDLNFIEEKEYYQLAENITGNFDDIMESKLGLMGTEIIFEDKEQLNLENIIESPIINDNRKKVYKENSNPLYRKITELKTIGLTNEEIAKRLNKGIREIEIVLKMYNNKN